MSKKYLLREFYKLCKDGICDHDLLTESEKLQIKNNDAMFLTGILQKADQENGNGRVYPLSTLQREVENYQRLIMENRALGELDHPDDSVINLKNVSHMVTKIWWDGKDVVGKIKILDTPSGNILKALVKNGVTLGISSRSLGSVTESKGKTIVEDDLQLICFDMVSEPSTSGAFMHLREAKQRTETSNSNGSKSERLHTILRDILGK